MITFPETIRACLRTLQTRYADILAANLVGIYVHGSLAMGCFNPASSDIDVLVVMKDVLSLATKKQLGQFHVALADQCPAEIELSIITRHCLDNFVHPTPYEFHYSEMHKAAYANQTADLTPGKTDYDLAAHCVITKRYGVALMGPPAPAIFPDVPAADYLDSIVRDAAWNFDNVMGGPDVGVCLVPQYAVLNYCRVLAFIREGLITSKQTGAEWALRQLPEQHHAVICAALNRYQRHDTAPQGDDQVDCQALKAFARYANECIND
ncbi:MAG: DUF4111 domain-containing protein [Anaerolineae bacterium]|nr:DUF4111 domain-containing protein [Anaerolineae bacterium]